MRIANLLGIIFISAGCATSFLSSPLAISLESSTANFEPTPECLALGDGFLVNGVCKSALIEVAPGHYDLSLNIKGLELEETIGEYLSITLEQFDGEGQDVPVAVPYLDRTIYDSSLSGGMLYPATGKALISDQYRELTLTYRPYPADSGWIVDPVRRIRVVLHYQGKGRLIVRDFRADRTEWNFPLKERDRCHAIQRTKFDTPPSVALMSQGPIEMQHRWLESALHQRLADIYILELSPASFVGSEISSETIALARLLQASGARWGIAYHPYWQQETQREPSTFQIASDAALTGIRERISWFINHGAEVVMLRADDLTPSKPGAPFSYDLTNKEDRNSFQSLARAHLALVESVFTHIPKRVKKYFVPPWYNSFFVRNDPESASGYFKELVGELDPQIGLIWTGPSVRSLTLDQSDLDSFRALIADHGLSYWDNTLYARRHKDFWLDRSARSHLLSFFEPYSVRLPGNYLFEQKSGEDLIILNGQLSSFNQVQFESARAYLAATNYYCPGKALRDAIARRWGGWRSREMLDLDFRYWSECDGDAVTSDSCREVAEQLRHYAEELPIVK